MSARSKLSLVGTAVGGLIGWTGAAPSADPASVRGLFADLGVRIADGADALEAVVRRFQERVGLSVDGIAGPRTVHLLAKYAAEARHLRRLEISAA